MINHVWWALVNDPDVAGQDGAAFKDPLFVTPLRLSAACSRVRDTMLGTTQVLDKATAITTVLRARRYRRYFQDLDLREVWPVARITPSTLSVEYLPALNALMVASGRSFINAMIPQTGTYGRFDTWYGLCRKTFDTAVHPFDRLAVVVSVYCHRSTFFSE